MSSTPIYGLRVSEVFQSLETSSKGLSTEEAAARRSLYGNNVLSKPADTPLWHKYLLQIRHPFVILLLVAGTIALWRGELTLSLVIWGLSILNSLFSFFREFRAEKAAEKLREHLPSFAHITREGQEAHVPSSEIVPGDVLVLAEGDNIPADARVVEEYGLRVNNAALTGEAMAARKTADASILTGISELERPNLIFAGTSVASGTGRAVVYATGMLTQFGRIAHLTQTVQEEPTQFQKGLERLSRIIMWVALSVGGLVWAATTQNPASYPAINKPLLLALGIIVAVTPEGLPATLTLSLAMAVQRLAARGVWVKRLSVVETLGNVSIICTDKSGTLTQNQMTVREVWAGRHKISVTGTGYEPRGQFLHAHSDPDGEGDLRSLLEAAMCCNNARVNPPSPEHPNWTSLGDQTEAALKVSALKFDLDEHLIGTRYPRVHEIPFDARRKRMTTIHRTSEGEVAFVKGAPREVLSLCSHIQIDGAAIPLNEALRKEIIAANDEYARRALRVLAMARRSLPRRSGAYQPETIERELTFLGLAAMMDPPRPEVERAVEICRQAGIRIVMITGDYGLTAESMARRIGLITTPSPVTLTGAELDEMNDASLQRLLEKEVIFARMAPDHKLRLVAAFQARGEVVAVTGDGVNDAPALRKADVGIAMGMVGTDVAKEAADVVLIQDNFGAIVTAIEEGRAIYDNIRKFITYIFSSNIPEVLPFLAAAAFGIPPALNVKQILAIDMGTDIFPALALGMEKPEPGVMLQPPRKRHTPLLDAAILRRAFLWLGLIEAGLCYLGFTAIYIFSGNAARLNIPFLAQVDWPRLLPFVTSSNLTLVAQTVFHAGVVTAQVGNAFACRTFKAHNAQMGWGSNRWLLLGIVIELTGIAALIYVPPLARAFEHVPLPLWSWGILILYALVIYTLEWLRKAVNRKFSTKL
jgi:magnesium-transporting ATPase (P-type)